MSYTFKTLTDKEAINILKQAIHDLAYIDIEDLTTFELNLLRNCVENPPNKRYGAENQINNG